MNENTRPEFVAIVSSYTGETTAAALFLTLSDKGVLTHPGLTAWLDGADLTATAVLDALTAARILAPADAYGEYCTVDSAEREAWLAELDAIREALNPRDSLAYGRG